MLVYTKQSIVVSQRGLRSLRTDSLLWFLLVLTSIFVRISEFFRRIYSSKNTAEDSASRFFFGWYSADKNLVANSDIRRRLGGLLRHILHTTGLSKTRVWFWSAVTKQLSVSTCWFCWACADRQLVFSSDDNHVVLSYANLQCICLRSNALNKSQTKTDVRLDFCCSLAMQPRQMSLQQTVQNSHVIMTSFVFGFCDKSWSLSDLNIL